MLKLRVIGDEKKDLFLVEPGIAIGSASGSGLLLTSSGVKPKHAQIDVAGGDKLTLKNVSGDTALLVNGKAVPNEIALKVGDEISLAGVRLMVVDPKSGFVAKAPEQASASPWSIRANHSALNNRVYPITGKMVLGRSNDCDITLSVSHLSRKHAELSVVGNKLVVKDLDSANGTFVNGKRITEDTLKKGDELRLDTLSFTVVGPADDMDKTSVRAAINPAAMATATKPAQVAATSSAPTAPHAPSAPRPAPKITASSQPAVESRSAGANDAGGSSTMMVAIIVTVVAIVAVAVYFFI
jgi:pSer/pThr/pTyr-binding forkhead associated (FHA) protein